MAHILFGGPAWAYGLGAGYYMAELGDDMTSIKSEPRLIEVNHDADDKASLPLCIAQLVSHIFIIATMVKSLQMV